LGRSAGRYCRSHPQSDPGKRNNEDCLSRWRPGHEGYANRVLQAWGVDGHNSHTNICSSGARFGYNIWYGYDRPSPDHANAKVILLISAHLESGHYFQSTRPAYHRR
jgi:hypothetical protein